MNPSFSVLSPLPVGVAYSHTTTVGQDKAPTRTHEFQQPSDDWARAIFDRCQLIRTHFAHRVTQSSIRWYIPISSHRVQPKSSKKIVLYMRHTCYSVTLTPIFVSITHHPSAVSDLHMVARLTELLDSWLRVLYSYCTCEYL